MSEDTTRQLPNDIAIQILAELGSLRGQMNAMQGEITSINARLTSLEERVDRRLMETRPIWEAVVARLNSIDQRVEAVEQRFNAIDQRFNTIDQRFDAIEQRFDDKIDNLALDMRAGFKRLDNRMADLAGEWNKVRTDNRDLERRMDRLEDRLTPEHA